MGLLVDVQAADKALCATVREERSFMSKKHFLLLFFLFTIYIITYKKNIYIYNYENIHF